MGTAAPPHQGAAAGAAARRRGAGARGRTPPRRLRGRRRRHRRSRPGRGGAHAALRSAGLRAAPRARRRRLVDAPLRRRVGRPPPAHGLMADALSPVTVVGAGSWGTAVAAIAADNGARVRLWCRREEIADGINSKRETAYLPGCVLPDGIEATSDLGWAVAGAAVVVMGVPSHAFREVLRGAAASM